MFLILRLGAESRVLLVNINSDILFVRIQLRLECCRSLTWGVVRVGREDHQHWLGYLWPQLWIKAELEGHCGHWRWFPGTSEITINWEVASYQQHQKVNWSHLGASLGHLNYISQHSRLTGCCLTLTLRVIHPGVCFVVKYTHCGSVAPFNKPNTKAYFT